MDTCHGPDSYITFLEQEQGRQILKELLDAIKHARPYKIRAVASVMIGVAVTALIAWQFKTWWGSLALLPSLYFLRVWGKESGGVTHAHIKLHKQILEWFFGEHNAKCVPCAGACCGSSACSCAWLS